MQLLMQKELAEITVTDISQAAEINRKTFYSHYAGTAAVLNEIEAEISGAYRSQIETMQWEELAQIGQVFHKLASVRIDNMEYWSALMCSERNIHLISKINNALTGEIKEILRNKTGDNSVSFHLMIDFVIGGLLAVYENWLLTERAEPLETIADQIESIVGDSWSRFFSRRKEETA